MKMLKWSGDPWEDVFNEKVCFIGAPFCYYSKNVLNQYFPTVAVDHLENPFPVLTWHGVNMAEGLKALPSTYRFTHNQSGQSTSRSYIYVLTRKRDRP